MPRSKSIFHEQTWNRIVRHCLAVFVTWFVLHIAANADAQTHAPRHRFSLHTGLQLALARDELLVPLTHSGAGTRIAFAYTQTRANSTLAAQIGAGFAPIWNHYHHIAATLEHQLQLTYTHALRSANRWQLGASAFSMAQINYFYKWDDAHAYWVNTQMLGPAVRWSPAAAGSWHLELTSSLGLVGIYQRPAEYRYLKQEGVNAFAYYLAEPFRNPAAAWIGNVQALNLDMQLHRVGRGWSFGHQLRFLRAREPLPSTNVSSFWYASRDWVR